MLVNPIHIGYMGETHEHIASQVKHARVHRALRSCRADELHVRAVFWRIAIPGMLLFWASVAYVIYCLV
jgi:hypothetical protein